MKTIDINSNKVKYVVWVVFILLISIPAVVKLGLPLSIGAEAKKAFDIIDGLPDGAVVLYSEGGTVGGWSEHGPGAEAMFQHIMSKNLRIIFLAIGTGDGPIQTQYMLNKYSDLADKKEYGVDYVELGFLPGGVAAAAAIAEDIHGAMGADYYGTTIADIEMMKDIHGAEDIDLIITIDNTAETEYYVTQWWSKYQSKIVVQTMVMMYSWLLPYRDAGQVAALISGVRGGAEYELLLNLPGEGLASTDMISLTHTAILILIAASNIMYFLSKGDET